MKHFSKKILRILSCFMVLVFASLNVNAEGLSTANKISQVDEALSQKGLSDHIIDQMSEQVKLEMYDKIQKYDDFFISKVETKTAHFDTPSSDLPAETRGTIPEDKLPISTFYTNYVSGNKIEMVELYYYSEWASGLPMVLGTDALTLNWDSGMFALQGFAAYNTCTKPEIPTQVITRAASAAQGGIGITFSLYSYGSSLEMLCTLIPREAMYTSPAQACNFNFEYSHQIFDVTPGISFSNDGVSVSFDGAVAYDTAAHVITYYSDSELVEDW